MLEKLNVPPDFDFSARSGDAPVNYVHRRAGESEVHFLASRRRRSEDLVCTFRVEGKRPEFWKPDTGERLYLDLGRVEVIADVRLNGKDLGILWKPPYRVDITDAVRPGDNDLEIRVTNLLANRLIGDEQQPAENEYGPDGGIRKMPDWYTQGKPKPAGGRVTFAAWKHVNKDSPLLESGLLGPVRLRTAVQRENVLKEK